MAGNPDFDNLLTTTLKNRTGKLADIISDNNALLKILREKGNNQKVDGGTHIVQELEYGQGDMTWYSGYDAINYTPKQLFTAAEFDIKLCAVPVGVSGEELLKNAGKERVIDLFLSKVKNAEKTMLNNMSTSIYGDGSAAGGKAIGGLQFLVADDPTTGSVGGIDRSDAANDWWRNRSTTSGAALTPATIRAAMDAMYLPLCRGTDHPDLIIADDAMYSLFEESLVAQQRFTNPKLADAGFQTLKYKGSDVVYDGGKGGRCPSKHMYFLNTDYIHFRTHKDRNMAVIGGERMAINQDALYKIIGWAGNMTLSNAQLQGVLKSA